MTALFGLWLACAASDPPGSAPAGSADPAGWTHYGAPFTVGEAVPASAVLADPAAHASGTVRFKGELTEVCQKMGCWAVVRDDAGHALRVTMKDHAFGIKGAAGQACDVEGQLVKKAVDPAQVEHFVSEGSKNPPEQGKTEAWELVASSVAVAI